MPERVDRHGEVVEPLDLEELDAVADALRAQGVEAIAVCFLHAYANPEHERAARDRLAERLPGVAITISSEITREWREYERASTAVLNAYVQPVVERYLADLEAALAARGLRGRPTRCSRTAARRPSPRARQRPINLVESGPAGGIMGAARIGGQIGEPNVIYLDIGGTTAKCSLIEDGKPRTTPSTSSSGAATRRLPGQGAGDRHRRDRRRRRLDRVVRRRAACSVGPRSAGAEPGPACYGRAAAQPTVTDAKLLAGVIDPDYFLGGRLQVYPALARGAHRPPGARLGIASREPANGVIRLVEREHDQRAASSSPCAAATIPRDFVLVACGGGGAMHAAALGAELRVKQVVVPPAPATSRPGACSSPSRGSTSSGLTCCGRRARDARRAGRVFGALHEEAAAGWAEEGGGAELVLERSMEMRYRARSTRSPCRSPWALLD